MLDAVEPGNVLLADKAYDSDALRDKMAGRGAWANVRAMPSRVKTLAFSAWLYRQRNAVERFFNKLKHFRAVAYPLPTSETAISSPQSSSLDSHLAWRS